MIHAPNSHKVWRSPVLLFLDCCDVSSPQGVQVLMFMVSSAVTSGVRAQVKLAVTKVVTVSATNLHTVLDQSDLGRKAAAAFFKAWDIADSMLGLNQVCFKEFNQQVVLALSWVPFRRPCCCCD